MVGRAHAQEELSLEQVVALALEKNYDVLLAKNQAEAAAKDRQFAPYALGPQLNATGSMLWTENDQELRFENAGNNREGDTKSKNTAASVQLSWVLFDGTRMFATLDRVNAIAAQGELIVKDQMVNTIADVITNYYDIVRQKQQLLAIQEQMAVSEERVKLADRKLQVGTGGKPELLQARVDYNAQRTQVIQQEALIDQLKQQLNELVGAQLPATYDVADTIIINLDLRQEDLSGNLENNNYTLQATRLNLEIARLALRERRGEYFPTISLNGAYNWTETDNIRLLNPFSPIFSHADGFNYGLTANIPLFNGGNTRRLVQQAKITYGRQQLLYSQLNLNTQVSLRNAYTNYDNAKKVLLIEEENILLAKENVFIALEGFKRSVTTFIELRTAQQSLADAYNRLINARYLAKAAETELLRLNGSLLR